MSKKEQRKQRKAEVLRLAEEYNSLASKASKHTMVCTTKFYRFSVLDRFLIFVAMPAVFLVTAIWFFKVSTRNMAMAIDVLVAVAVGFIVALVFYWVSISIRNEGEGLPFSDEQATQLLQTKIDQLEDILDLVDAERMRLKSWLEKFAVLEQVITHELCGSYTLHESVNGDRCNFYAVVKFLDSGSYVSYSVKKHGYKMLEAVVAERWWIMNCDKKQEKEMVKALRKELKRRGKNRDELS